jgi:hypothetical protein
MRAKQQQNSVSRRGIELAVDQLAAEVVQELSLAQAALPA